MERIPVYLLKNIDYKESIMIQDELQSRLINRDRIGFILFAEYGENIFTQGKYGNSDNILIDTEKLEELGLKLYRTDRGGDVTYHGPGQIVCYPVLNLKKLNLTIKRYVFLLEEVIKSYLKEFGIDSKRINGNPGIWVERKKIASIGVNVKKFITKHGFSLNLNNETSFYNYINPCGFNKLEITSVKNELCSKSDLSLNYTVLLQYFESLLKVRLDYEFINLNLDNLEKIKL
ncbi:MAG: lipoyl(octanoyl) transferase LipB [Candidatus Dadabacteria bacterium]|nr:lipoyl(octanoyl) transferase LipB [Candidatus Dadabacteria bacterium]NIQ16030.1 lipoyl(octanoyl) transferase LipB [Candidatus Dadabacteria bacterium]